jgi:tRNA threonylcarbamoyladenosine biosynthesis protein TsaE
VHIHTPTAADTEALGARLAHSRPADAGACAVVYLQGELGSGKTTLARGFLKALGVEGPVRSPTYTLVELHPAGSLTLVHADLYRLRDPSELESVGLREWAAPGYLWLVEWPEKGAGRLPPADLALALSSGVSGHEVELSAPGSLGRAWLARLQAGAGASPG